NLCENASTLTNMPVFENLKDLFRDYVGIVVATGPSLNKTISLILEIPNAVIVACDSAVPVLLKYGIHPHFITSIERVVHTAELIRQFGDQNIKSYYVYPPIIHPESIAAFKSNN